VNYYFQQGYSRENEKRIKLSKRPQNLAVTKYAQEDSRRHQKAWDQSEGPTTAR
jgi:hypothetical protein